MSAERRGAPPASGRPVAAPRYMLPTLSLPRAPLEPLHKRSLPRPPVQRPSSCRGRSRPMSRLLESQLRRTQRFDAETLLEQSDIYRSRRSQMASMDESSWSPSSACSPHGALHDAPEAGRGAAEIEGSSAEELGRGWLPELEGTMSDEDLQPEAPVCNHEQTACRPVSSLAQSAKAFMEKRRQVEEAESSAALEWQQFILKKTSVVEEPEVAEETPKAHRVAPLSIAELYQLCNQVSKTLLIPITEVKSCFDDFCTLDLDGSFSLSADEFERAVRKSCKITEDEPLPQNLALKYSQMDADGNRVVDFKEYVRWSQGASWSEQLLVRDERDREARKLARQHGIHLLDVERLRRVFDRHSSQTDRVITQDRFGHVIRSILKVTDPSDVPSSRLERYWREIDLDASGTVDFEEFVIWMSDRGPQQGIYLSSLGNLE